MINILIIYFLKTSLFTKNRLYSSISKKHPFHFIQGFIQIKKSINSIEVSSTREFIDLK